MSGTSAVITGTGVLCSTAADTAAFTDALRAGRTGIRTPPGQSPAADLTGFDFAGAVTGTALPTELRRAALRAAGRSPLPVQTSVAVALEAWHAAGLHRDPPAPQRVGLVVAGHNLGAAHGESLRPRFEANPAHLPPRYALHHQDTDHVGTVSQALDIQGEGCTVGGASASGGIGIIHAARLVTSGAVDLCLLIGAMTILGPMQRQSYLNVGAMAGPQGTGGTTTGECPPFDRHRRGFVPGQGAACLVLEPAQRARGRGAAVLAEVSGWATRLAGDSLAGPSEAAETAVMHQALAMAGLTPGRIGYVNTHGTGSRQGDETELRALRRVFGPDAGRPWINATKGLVGHCLSAAGVIEAVATIAQLRGGFVHPNARLAHPMDPGLRFAGDRAEPAETDFALSNSFGFGGFNACVVLGRGAPA